MRAGSSTAPTPARVDIAGIRQRCPDAFGREECNRRFAECGYHYGPTFQGIARLWRGDREILAEIHVAEQLERYICPTIDCIRQLLTPAFQTLLPILWTSRQSVKGEIFVPVKIERIRFHATPPIRAFAYTRVSEFRSDGTQGRPADPGRGRQLPASRCRG